MLGSFGCSVFLVGDRGLGEPVAHKPTPLFNKTNFFLLFLGWQSLGGTKMALV